MPRPATILFPILLALLCLAGCASPRRGPRPPGLHPTESRIDAVPGRTLVLPVDMEGPHDPSEPLSVLLDDGRSLPATLHWISVTPPASARPDWIAAEGLWSATPAEAHARPPGVGFWAVVLATPPDAAGQGIWLGRNRVSIHWLPAPATLRVDESAWTRLVTPEALAGSRLDRLAEPAWRSPLRRWRHRLLTRGLRPSAQDAGPVNPPLPGTAEVSPDGFADPVVEALARQFEARWQVGLAWLWEADADLAARVRRRLAATVDFGGGVLAPAWPVDPVELDALLTDLTTPGLSIGRRAQRARAWLDAQPQAAAWVIDDAGITDAGTGRPLSTLGVANLGDRATLAWAEGGAPSPELVPVSPGQTRQLVASPIDAGRHPRITIHAGRWSTQRTVLAEPLVARPPGLRMAPFTQDWAMHSWLAGGGDPGAGPGPEWATAALLLREDSAGEDDPGWTLLVECRLGDGAAPTSETVRVWVGPFGSPIGILRAGGDGSVTEEAPVPRGLAAGARVTATGERWIVRVRIPPECIGGDGTLRLGLERNDALGRHTAWPRTMLPWQLEPGRAVIDLQAWDAGGAER